MSSGAKVMIGLVVLVAVVGALYIEGNMSNESAPGRTNTNQARVFACVIGDAADLFESHCGYIDNASWDGDWVCVYGRLEGMNGCGTFDG
jgi:hypothetical protein